MSAFAKEFANKELRGIIDGKDNVFNKTCRGWSSRHSTPSKAQAFETPTRPARAEGAVLGLPATGQAAAHFLAVTVTLYFNIILNAWFFFFFFLTISNSRAYQKITRDHFPMMIPFAFMGSPCWWETERNPTFFIWTSLFHFKWQHLNKIHFFLTLICGSFSCLLLSQRLKDIAETWSPFSHGPGLTITVAHPWFLSHRPAWQFHLVLMWPSHGSALRIPRLFTINQMHRYESCYVFRRRPKPRLDKEVRFSLMFRCFSLTSAVKIHGKAKATFFVFA